MSVGILGAMPEEVELLLQHLEGIETKCIAGSRYYVGSLYGKKCVVVRTGWGKVASAACAQTLIHVFSPTAIVCIGSAGSLKPDWEKGSIVVSREAAQHDVHVSQEIPKELRQQFAALRTFKADRLLVRLSLDACQWFLDARLTKVVKAEQLLHFGIKSPKVGAGIVLTGDQLIDEERLAEEIKEKYPDGDCVEMEGASVAQVCDASEVPFVIIRVISDAAGRTASREFPDFVKHVLAHYSYGIVDRLLQRMPKPDDSPTLRT